MIIRLNFEEDSIDEYYFYQYGEGWVKGGWREFYLFLKLKDNGYADYDELQDDLNGGIRRTEICFPKEFTQ